jgi:uncharacterized membrane protein HdeD (DUF308 family)
MINSTDNRKTDILEKSRRSRSDEGLEFAQVKGFKPGEYTLTVAAVSLIFFSFFTKELAVFLALGILIFAHVFSQSLAVYRFTKRKYHLAWVILSIVCTIHFTVDFILLFSGNMNPLWLQWWLA